MHKYNLGGTLYICLRKKNRTVMFSVRRYLVRFMPQRSPQDVVLSGFWYLILKKRASEEIVYIAAVSQ